MENSILFNPKFKQHELVCHRTAISKPYIVINYCISGITDKSVSQYTIGVGDDTGSVKWFSPQELVKYDKNKALIEDENYTEEEEGT